MVQTQLPTGTPVWSCSIQPAVGSAVCVAGPHGPRVGPHKNAPVSMLSFGSFRPGSHLLPSAAPTGQKPPLRRHLRLLPSVLTTYEFGLLVSWGPLHPTPSQPPGLRVEAWALCVSNVILDPQEAWGRGQNTLGERGGGEVSPACQQIRGFLQFGVRLLAEQPSGPGIPVPVYRRKKRGSELETWLKAWSHREVELRFKSTLPSRPMGRVSTMSPGRRTPGSGGQGEGS